MVFLHQTTTPDNEQQHTEQLFLMVFLHQTTTVRKENVQLIALFLMVFLHQTTTRRLLPVWRPRLFLMVFLHQTTTYAHPLRLWHCCFLWCSYIKPQRFDSRHYVGSVVSYGVPTSNHNVEQLLAQKGQCCFLWCSYIKPQPASVAGFCSSVVSYGVPTSNHNAKMITSPLFLLFLMVFLHQTTTLGNQLCELRRCFLWCSYIKPQPVAAK